MPSKSVRSSCCRHRAADRPQKIILLVSETRDNGSYARGRQTLIALQLSNVTLYSVDISQLSRRLTEQAEPPRPDPIPPEARSLPRGVNTPLAAQQATGWGNSAEFHASCSREIYTDAKGGSSSAIRLRFFTKGTGGAKFSFLRQRGLRKTPSPRLAQEIHSQYILSYTPRKETLLEGGFHELRINVDYPRARVQTRPGYHWLAAIN